MNLHSPLYHYWQQVLSSELCNLIINLLDPVDRTTGTVGNTEFGTQGLALEQYRNSSVSGVGKPHWLYGIVEYYLHQANEETFHYDLGETQLIQYSTYAEGQQYTWHRDSGGPPDDQGRIRKLSMSIQLDDPATFSGGEFQISNFAGTILEPAEFKPQGSIIVFPSMCLHRVAPVTQGTRRSLVAWVLGPTFR